MDEGTPKRRTSVKGNERAEDSGSKSSSRDSALRNTTNARLGAAFAASTPASPSLSVPVVTAELSNPASPNVTRTSANAPSRHGRTPNSSASSAAHGDYFSHPAASGPSISPAVSRRPTRTPGVELWSGPVRQAEQSLPAIREHSGSTRSSSIDSQTNAPERPSLATVFGQRRSDGPVYPNQSLSMLTRQIFPVRPPPALVPVRPDIMRPTGSALRDPRALNAARVAPIRDNAVEERLRSIMNTPVQSPGAGESMYAQTPFGPEYLLDKSAFENAYLHPLTAAAPKT